MALFITRTLLKSKFKLKQQHYATTTSKVTTAGVIIVGDEILKGQVIDTNSHFLANELHNLGIELKKISVIGDIVSEVSKEVKQFSNTYDFVITSGGIGPTHDDITYEGVARAFNETLICDPILKELCHKFYQTKSENDPGMKLAFIPKSAKLNFSKNAKYPSVSVRNVYMFPGIPELLMSSFSKLAKDIFKSQLKFYSHEIYINANEDKIVEVLNQLVDEFPDVQFGSYPKLFDSDYKVKITIESYDETTTKAAFNKLMSLVPKDYVVAHKEH